MNTVLLALFLAVHTHAQDASTAPAAPAKCAGLEKFYPCVKTYVDAEINLYKLDSALIEVGQKGRALCNQLSKPGSQQAEGTKQALEEYRKGYRDLSPKQDQQNRIAVDTSRACSPLQYPPQGLLKACADDLEKFSEQVRLHAIEESHLVESGNVGTDLCFH